VDSKPVGLKLSAGGDKVSVTTYAQSPLTDDEKDMLQTESRALSGAIKILRLFTPLPAMTLSYPWW
jgi:hypothetical protein